MKIKLLNEKAKIPQTAGEGSAGFDIWGIFDVPIVYHDPYTVLKVPTGFATEFDKNLVARVWERGSTGSKNIQVRAGVVDSDFRGEWKIFLTNGNSYPVFYVKGEEGTDLFNEAVTSLANLYQISLPIPDKQSILFEGDFLYIVESSEVKVPIALVYSQEKAIAQFVMLKIEKPMLEAEENLGETNRGEGMLGSSGH